MDNRQIIAMFGKSLLAASLTNEEIMNFLEFSKAQVKDFASGETVFFDGDVPQSLYVLLSGKIHIQKTSLSGRNVFISKIDEPGDVFGEAYLLLEKPYDMFAEAVQNTSLLVIDGKAFSFDINSAVSLKVHGNLTKILAQKAYLMHTKLKVMASGKLRERIVRFLFWEMDEKESVHLSFSRDEWATYLAVARPSLSRELGTMERDGIIEINGRNIRLVNRNKFEEYL